MDKVKPVRAMLRVLDVLQVLNSRNGVTVTDVANAIDLPRTTAYRVLETLCSAGYAVRDTSDDHYRLTVLVRCLSDGYDDEAWVTEVAQPVLSQLGRKLVWPVSISTNQGNRMLLRYTTDKQSPLALERYNAGVRLPLLNSATGRSYLAFSPAPQRAALLDIALGSGEEMEGAGRERALIEKTLSHIRKVGYAISVRQYRGESTAAVPIYSGTNLLGCVGMRFMDKAVTESVFATKYVPDLKAAAAEIGDSFTEWKEARDLNHQQPLAPTRRWDWTLERRVEH
ncbi:helix-turn-helix domain-containing protein [Niveispirillum sp. SYP-B3756]|uniref:helix-turn-helix domain-containing protein n=2 Tax=Azospirillaceae TaxID=2829815 RepID=UPI000B6691B2|nr:helix-turn-helix domain-containing protein [Niveispirillum sp. SYP-B3756]MQP66552.1 helix-turn-helix domain-containing protein [Niveispirillum sp. SYP-B3756]SNS15192.1 transcriptional regulator, IclR family [Azospirillum sp. RU38E]SNS32462.1 transcriptional regulator, IclR family [Azospirillum sp. RU37A]